MAPRLVLHVGLAKTGTTSFQHACHRHRRILARHGVLYPRANEGFARNHSPLVAAYLTHRPHDPTIALRVPSRAQAIAALRDEIAARDPRVTLVSSEHFSLHFDPYEAAHLAEDLAGLAVDVVAAVREPYGRFLSLWNTHVTAGGCLTLDAFARSLLVPDNRFFSLREILKIWRGAFGADRVAVIDYDRVPDVGAAILAQCGMEAPLPASRRRRASLPLAAVERLRAVNAAILARQDGEESRGAWAQRSLFSALAQRRLLREPPPEMSLLVSTQTMAALDAIAANDRAFLADTYGIDLASTRHRYAVGTPSALTPDAEATALLDDVSRGLWQPTRALAGLWDRRTGG